MPDTTNEELKRLIQYIIVKVRTIETKLDALCLDREQQLEKESKSKAPNVVVVQEISQTDDLETEPKTKSSPVSYVIRSPLKKISPGKQQKPKIVRAKSPSNFHFTPINDDKELSVISKKILHDPFYKSDLQTYIKSKGDIKLENIFSLDFLLKCNHTGANGQRNMENLVPYQQIFRELLLRSGKHMVQIRTMSLEEINRLKNRVRMANIRNKEKFGTVVATKTADKSLDVNENDADEQESAVTSITEHNYATGTETKHGDDELIEEILFEEVEEDMVETLEQESMPATAEIDEGDDETESETEVSQGEVFKPIASEADLARVSFKIRSDANFLKELRLKMVNEAKIGPCNLEQLFTPEYLRNINYQKITQLLPYEAVYCFLKKQIGQSDAYIEDDAKTELRKVKKRLQDEQQAERQQQKRMKVNAKDIY
ncbi:uncharacterized protein LOC134833967 [Culicoides brevitarsis]|uniref:uncharacterized protein LOC134833967 n=1 Tax=Culicoides brevitarsis TaxID=469753 RepID=UPI00307C3E40